MKRPWTTFAGVLLAAAAGAHGLLGWPAMSAELVRSGVDDNLRGALAMGWTFGTASMVAFSAIALMAAWTSEPWNSGMRRTLVAISAGYIVFGAAALIARGGNPHFLVFVVLGGLVLVGALRD